MTINTAMYVAFALWLLALILILFALTPRKWRVDPTILKQDPNKFSDGLGIEDYFTRSAIYKRRLIFASSLLFFVGIFTTIFAMG